MTKQTQNKVERNVRRSRRTNEQAEVKVMDMSENQIYDILEDEMLTAEEKEAKLLEMLVLNTESAESVAENTELVSKLKQVLKQALEEFSEQNKKSIEMSRDNPLSKLSSGIQEVFANYHVMASGREDLKGTLANVDKVLQDMGGEEQLVSAMLKAKDRSQDLKNLQDKLAEATTYETAAKIQRNDLRKNRDLKIREISNAKAEFFSFLKGSNIATLEAELEGIKLLVNEASTQVLDAEVASDDVRAEIKEMRSSEEFSIHEKILAILDIGNTGFKQKLADLAGVTLTYIDDTQRILSNVRNQLEVLLTDVDKSLDVNVNIRERMTIMSSVLVKANDASIDVLDAFKKNAENEESSLIKLENEKVTRVADAYIAELGDTMTSSAMINAEVQKIEVVIMSLRDQLKNGLLDANEQILISGANATATGMLMMNKAQALGALAQGVVAKGQYMTESEETFGDLADQFRTQLAVRAGRNDTLDSMTDVLHTISETLEDTNVDNADLIGKQREIVLDLNDGIERLKDAAETARNLQSSAKVGDYA